jgi:starch phosphorylase
MMKNESRTIAYFSMEIGVRPEMPTYSGGLGVLAGDTIRSAADLKVPMAAVTLLHRKGYFYQRLDKDGGQLEEPVEWVVEDFLKDTGARVSVKLAGRTVQVRAWTCDVAGATDFVVPVYFLDTDVPENSEADRTLTDNLYGGDSKYRLCQEAILGIAGVRMLRALGYRALERFHMNEGHAALLALELLDEAAKQRGATAPSLEDVQAIRTKCVFTTHTPVPAGHDRFPIELVQDVLGSHPAFAMKDVFCCDDSLNMTFLALNVSHYVNGVAKRHGEVSRQLFGRREIDWITNGIHAATWTASSFLQLFDRHVPGWKEDNFSLRYALGIPPEEVWQAHRSAKQELMHYVNRETNAGMDVDILTLGFARRATPYKRPTLLFHDVDRLRRIASEVGKIQVVYAGKAHPQDSGGKEAIRSIFKMKEMLKRELKIVYLANYDLELGKLITAGVDVWLNTPEPPLEASGTSGMKAAINGVPSLSIPDGWWLEGCIEGVTGWSIARDRSPPHGAPISPSDDAISLYDKLERIVIPLYYHERNRFINVMQHAIALNGSFFNTQRMIQQYIAKAYFE